MKRDVEERARQLAARQHGIVTRGQLRRCGMSDDSVDRRIRSGELRPLFRGVYRMGPVIAPHAHEMAATLACGPDAVASHRTVAALWQVAGAAPEQVQVTVPPGRKCVHRGIRVHRSELSKREITRWEGIPVTTPARTLLDLAGELDGRPLERAVAEAYALRLTTEPELRRVVQDHPGVKGARVLTRLLAAGPPAFTRSEAEESLLGLLRRGRLPEPLVNHPVAGLEVDFHWPQTRLVVEVDGYASHGSRRSFERDHRRDALLMAAGWRVMRITARQVKEEPEATLVQVTQAMPQAVR